MNLNINEYIDEKIHLSLKSFLNKNDRVLEIGSGFGEYSFKIANNVKHIVVLDMDDKKLAKIKKKIISDSIDNITIVKSKIEDYIPEKKFDKIIIIQSIGYILPKSFIDVLNYNLKVSGDLFILDLSKSLIFTTRRKIKYFFNTKIPRANNYSKKEIGLITELFSYNSISYYGLFIILLPFFFFFSKNIRIKIYNKFDNFIYLRKLSFKYLLICKNFHGKRLK